MVEVGTVQQPLNTLDHKPKTKIRPLYVLMAIPLQYIHVVLCNPNIDESNKNRRTFIIIFYIIKIFIVNKKILIVGSNDEFVKPFP